MYSTAARSALTSTRTVQDGAQRSLPFAPSLRMRGRATARRAPLSVSAGQNGLRLPENVESMAQDMGFDTEDGVFGFKPFNELFVGRAAMAGFGLGLGTEMATGQGILAQVHLSNGTPNPVLFAALVLAMTGGTYYAGKQTLEKIASGDMSVKQFMLYAEFFGLSRNQKIAAVEGYKETRRVLGKTEEPVEPPSTTDSEEASGVSDAATPFQAVATSGVGGYGMSEAAELEYAKEVEIQNGRAAMLGFAAAILVEAATGGGMLPQFFGYLQATGILGPGMYEILIQEFTQYTPPGM